MTKQRWTIVLYLVVLLVANLTAKDGDRKDAAPGKDALVLDLGGNGIDLGGMTTTKLLGGKPRKVAWTKAGTDDAFLVLDADALVKAKYKVLGGGGAKLAGKVLLGGDVTVFSKKDEGKSNVQAGGCAWLSLRDLDTNRDGKVDPSDPTWACMKAWTDTNADGTIGADEVRGLSDAAVQALTIPNVAPEDVAKVDDAGNVRVDGEFTLADGKTACVTAVSLAAAK